MQLRNLNLKNSQLYKGRQYHGFGLLEVLIVLAIVASTMVAATQISLEGYKAIKVNELTDYSNSVLLQALELVKAPGSINISAATQPNGFNGSYKLRTPSGTSGRVTLDRISSSLTAIGVEQCSDTSPYYTATSDDSPLPDPLLCTQIIVEEVTGSTGLYRMTSRVVFTYEGVDYSQSIVNFRQGGLVYGGPAQ